MDGEISMGGKSEHDQIVLYGTDWCGDCVRSTKFLKSQGIPFRWVDINQDSDARVYVRGVNNGMVRVPTILFPDGSILVEPSNSELAEMLRKTTDS
jgi:glutaredoxin-like protein